MLNYYEILQVANFAETEVIKASYKALSKKYHPDINKNINPEIMVQINEAYDILKDEEKKAKYDIELKSYLENSSDHNKSELSSEYDSFEENDLHKDTNRKSFIGIRLLLGFFIAVIFSYIAGLILVDNISRDGQWVYFFYPFTAYFIGMICKWVIGNKSYVASILISLIVITLFLYPYYGYLFDTLPIIYGNMSFIQLAIKATQEIADLLLFSGVIRFFFIMCTPFSVFQAIYED